MDAFTALYERYLPTVYKRIRFVIPEEDVDDITQEVFIAVVKSLKSFRYERVSAHGCAPWSTARYPITIADAIQMKPA